MPEPTMTREALAGLLAAVEPGRGASVTGFRPITGGYSRLSAVADVLWDDGATERLVLRGDPLPGEGVFVSDRDAEWELLRALVRTGGAPPIPAPRWYDATGEHFGTKCIVVEHVRARSLQDVLRAAEDTAAPARSIVDTVAGIHATPLDGLPATMQHPPSWDDYVDGVLDLYRGIGGEITDSRPVLRYVAARLSHHRPPPVPFTLVHGDCQPSNVLVTDAGENVVIDWEFARIGDPREDLGWLCVRAWRFGADDRAVGGLCERAALFAAYERAGGRPVDADAVRWWEIFGNLKWAVICIMQARTFLDGGVQSVELASLGRRVVEMELELLELTEA